MEHYTLNYILDKYYDEKNGVIENYDDSQQRKEFQNNHQKDFKEIINALGIKKEFTCLKTSKGYQFATQEDVEFWVKVLMNFSSSEMDSIRRGERLDPEHDAFVVWLCDGILATFRHANVPIDDFEGVIQNFYNNYDYPERKERIIINSMLQKLIGYKEDHLRSLRSYDVYIWLLRMERDCQRFVNRWINIFNCIIDLRNEEFENYSNEYGDEEKLSLQRAFEDDIDKALASNEEYCKLERRYNTITGYDKEEAAKEFARMMRGNSVRKQASKNDYIKKRGEEQTIMDQMSKIKLLEWEKVKKTYIELYNFDPDEARKNFDYSKFMTSEDLLDKAEMWEKDLNKL